MGIHLCITISLVGSRAKIDFFFPRIRSF